MTLEERNLAVMRSIYDAYSRKDPNPLFDAMSDTGKFQIIVSRGHFGFAGAGKGKAGIRRIIVRIVDEYEWLRFELNELIAQGDRVVALTGGKIRHRPTGAMINMDLVDVVRLRAGKIVDFKEYADTAGMLAKQGQLTIKAAKAPARKKAKAKRKRG